MKKLKIILGSVYVVLIVLLLLLMLRKCQPTPSGEPPTRVDTVRVDSIVVIHDTVVVEPPVDTTTVDTTAVREAEETGNSGALKVTLLWDFYADIDLHVVQPNGKEIYFKYPKDRSTGGQLDVDNRSGGEGAAENIYWSDPPSGEYKVSIVYYKEVSSIFRTLPQTGTCTVVVMQEGREPRTYKVEMARRKEKKEITTVVVP